MQVLNTPYLKTLLVEKSLDCQSGNECAAPRADGLVATTAQVGIGQAEMTGVSRVGLGTACWHDVRDRSPAFVSAASRRR